MKATFLGETIAESDETLSIEGQHYFPPSSVKQEFLKESKTQTTCPYKGRASYFDVVVHGQASKDAAWTYKEPNPGYEEMAGFVAFWKGVHVE